MFKQKEIEFDSTNLVNRVKGVVYIPEDKEIKGILQICHGMCEYIDRYSDFAKFLCENGYIVCGHDHVGHGKSSAPEQYGFFSEEKGWQVLVDDLYKFTHIIKDMFPEYPVYLLGHSMGSFIARLYASYFPTAIEGLIISGTGYANPAAKAGITLCNITAKKKGNMYRSEKINKLAFGNFNNRYPDKRTDYDWVCGNNAVVDKYMKDDKCMFTFTLSGFKDLFTLNCKANESTTFKNTKDMPIFIFSGDMDPVGDFGKGVTKVYNKYSESGKNDITFRLYRGGRHEMLNEVNKEEVYIDVLSWLNEKSKANKQL